jgi:hypothetical protein
MVIALPPSPLPRALTWLVEDGARLDDLARELTSPDVDDPAARLAALKATQDAFWRLREIRWWILEDGPAA